MAIADDQHTWNNLNVSKWTDHAGWVAHESLIPIRYSGGTPNAAGLGRRVFWELVFHVFRFAKSREIGGRTRNRTRDTGIFKTKI